MYRNAAPPNRGHELGYAINSHVTHDLPPLAHQVPAACHRIGLGRTGLYALIKAGEIKPIKVGARTLIPEAELQRFIQRKIGEAA